MRPSVSAPQATRLAAALLLSLCITGISAAQTVAVWHTTNDGSKKLQQEPSVSFQTNSGTSPTTITVDETTTYQVMDGFGAAITGSAAYVINQKMSAVQRSALMDDLFTNTGIGMTYVRRPMGASDFDLVSYTYDDMPSGSTDPGLANFSIDYDRTDIIPVLKAALQKNPSLKVMASPWTAPAWMKKPESLNGGSLSSGWYGTYADYFVRFVQAYQAEGIPVEAITIQNEPLHTTGQYPSMGMSARVQTDFLKNYLGPAFSNAGLSTKIIVYDHNWDKPDYPISVLNDPLAKSYAAGTAFHGYAGDVSAQSQVHDAHPDKGIWFTEITGGDWDTNFGSNVNWVMTNIIIGTTRNWGKGIIYWNLALDESGGPQNGGCSNCRGVVTINSQNGSITRNPEYYLIGHISKFVDPGAIRISSDIAGGIQTVAFDNAGKKTLIAHNSGTSATSFKVLWGDQAFEYALAAGDAATFTWTGTQSGGGEPPPPGDATSMSVQSVVTGTESAGKGSKRGTAVVTVHDNLGQPAVSATVTGTFSGSFNETVSGTTGADGTITLKTSATASGGVTVNFCINDVTHASLTYDPAQNDPSVTSCAAGKGSENAHDREMPDAFGLHQPYPNPFNPSTNIAFDLPEAGVVSLTVHNVLGQRVGVLLDQKHMAAGRHTVTFAASHLVSGAYFIRLTAGNEQFTSGVLLHK